MNRGLRDAARRRRDPELRHRGHRRLARPARRGRRAPRRRDRHAAHESRVDLHAAAARSSTRSSSRARTRGSTSAPRSCASTRSRLLPEVITGVGFCMYVTRQALDLCGLLDEETFGRGYGEEVDFCLRASRLGLRHLVEDSTFVYHRGGVSFGDGQSEGLDAELGDHRRPLPVLPAEQHARARHRPVRRVVRGARARAARARRDAAARAAHPAQPARRDGRHREVRRRAARRRSSTSSTSRCSTRWSRASCSRTYWIVDGRRVEHEFLLAGRGQPGDAHERRGRAAQRSSAALDLFDFDAVHIHNLIGHSLAPFDALADFPGPVVCSVHDLFLACPNFSLLYMKSDPCGIPDDLSVCARCLADIAESPMPGSPPMPNVSRRVPRRVPRHGRRAGSTPSTTGCSRARARPTTSCASTTPIPLASRSSSTVR